MFFFKTKRLSICQLTSYFFLFFSLQISRSFVKVAVVYAILELTRYLSQLQHGIGSFCAITLLSLAQSVISLVFSALISVLYIVQISLRLSTRSSSSCFSLSSSMSSGGRRLVIQSNLRMWSPPLRDHLSLAATFRGSLEPKYSSTEPVLRGHLS